MSILGRGTRISYSGVPEGGKSIQIVGLGIYGRVFHVRGAKASQELFFFLKKELREM